MILATVITSAVCLTVLLVGVPLLAELTREAMRGLK